MENHPSAQAQPQAAHAQPVDPVAEALEGAGDGEPGQALISDPNLLQEILPEIKDLAQKVGGMKKLAEIAEMLEQPEG